MELDRDANGKVQSLNELHVDITSRAHKKVPLQSNLRTVWFMITLAVTITWTSVYLDKDLSEKTCYVKENSDGTFMIMQDVDESQLLAENIHNVGNRFQYLSVSYLA